MALEDFVDLKLGHYNKDGIGVVDVEGEIDVYTAPRLRELLIDLVNKNNYQLVVNMEKVEFLDSTGLGVLVGGLKRVRAHDGSLDLVCTPERGGRSAARRGAPGRGRGLLARGRGAQAALPGRAGQDRDDRPGGALRRRGERPCPDGQRPARR